VCGEQELRRMGEKSCACVEGRSRMRVLKVWCKINGGRPRKEGKA
jgi:hypothetical protein